MNEPTPQASSTADLNEATAVARARFLDVVTDIRPRLHQFCARMTGSVFDGEDIVQETLAEAFFKFAGLRDERRLEPWMFRIAHNKAIDFLRRNRELTGVDTEEEADMNSAPEGEFDREVAITDALTTLITQLPPRERACIVLKDVLGHELQEIAVITDTTLGAIKSALHRGRAKLAALEQEGQAQVLDGGELRLLEAYVRCFNAHDWDGASRLLSADARLELVGRLEATGADFITSTYYRNYEAMQSPWRFEVWEVDGTPMAMMLREFDGEWRPHAGFRLRWKAREIIEIRDYIYVPYLYAAAVRQRCLNDGR